MIASRSVSLLLVAALALLIAGSDGANAQEALGDGGFESGSLAEAEAGLPEVFDSWAVTPSLGDNSTAAVVTDPVLTGTYAAQLDTRSAASRLYMYQDVAGTPCFTWTFSVYRGEGINWVELVADWDRGGGAGSAVSAVIFTDDLVELRTWDTRANSPEGALSAGEWHEVVVQADATNLVQTFSIDGSEVAKVQADTAESVPGTIIIGDVSGNAQHGLYTYDDVSLEAEDCPAAGEESPDTAAEETPLAETAAEETVQEADDDGFPWWLIVIIVIAAPTALLIVLGVARRRRRTDQE